MGLVSDQQKADVEQLLATDQEIQSQLSELEVEMEQHFLRHAVPPPPHIRQALLQQVNETGIQKRPTYPRPEDVKSEPEPAKSPYIDVEVSNTYIQVHKYWRPAFIAVFVLSKIFLILGLYYYFKSSTLEQEVSRLKAATQQTAPSLRNRTQ